MTVEQILEQAQALSIAERKELVKLLVDSIDAPSQTREKPAEHRGKSLNRLLETMDAGAWGNSDIEDPVEAVKHQRELQRRKRPGDWGE